MTNRTQMSCVLCGSVFLKMPVHSLLELSAFRLFVFSPVFTHLHNVTQFSHYSHRVSTTASLTVKSTKITSDPLSSFVPFSVFIKWFPAFCYFFLL